MILNIISASSPAFRVEVTKAFFPGVDGSFEVLRNHAPLIAALGKGEVRWDGGSRSIRSGFVRVMDNVITAVVEE